MVNAELDFQNVYIYNQKDFRKKNNHRVKCHSWLYSSVQSLIRVWLFVTPWIAARQACLSITNSQSSLRLTSIESVMPSSHLILSRPLLLLSSIFPNTRVFSNESALHVRWPKYCSFSFNINPSNKHPGLIFFIIISNSPFRFFCAFFGICVSGISVSHLSYYNKMYLHKFKDSQLNKSEQHRCQLIHSTLLEMETDWFSGFIYFLYRG